MFLNVSLKAKQSPGPGGGEQAGGATGNKEGNEGTKRYNACSPLMFQQADDDIIRENSCRAKICTSVKQISDAVVSSDKTLKTCAVAHEQKEEKQTSWKASRMPFARGTRTHQGPNKEGQKENFLLFPLFLIVVLRIWRLFVGMSVSAPSAKIRAALSIGC